MQAFVTGSTGLLGSNLVQLLVAQGYTVKALVRSRQKAARLLPTQSVELIEGDMEDVAAFASALKGCDVVFHTAAYFREYYAPGDHWSKLERINIHGTLELLRAAEKHGVKKVIHVSSSGVIGRAPDGKPGDETHLLGINERDNLYFKSKLLGDEKILDFLKTSALPVVLILPTAMFGPGDAGPTSAGKIILDFLSGNIPVIPPGGFSTVDARDVAQAAITAVERGQSGERYIISDQYHSVYDIMQLLSQITGLAAPRIQIPYWGALLFAYASEFRARLTNTDAVATINGIKTLNSRQQVTAAKAIRELGLTVRPFEQTLRDEIAWYIKNGYTKPTPAVIQHVGVQPTA